MPENNNENENPVPDDTDKLNEAPALFDIEGGEKVGYFDPNAEPGLTEEEEMMQVVQAMHAVVDPDLYQLIRAIMNADMQQQKTSTAGYISTLAFIIAGLLHQEAEDEHTAARMCENVNAYLASVTETLFANDKMKADEEGQSDGT